MHLRNIIATTCALLTLLSASARAQGERSDSLSTVPSDPVFEVRKTDGTTVEGRIAAIEADGTWTLDTDEGPVELPLEDLVSLTRNPWPTASRSAVDRSVVVFPSGDRLRAIIGKADDEALSVQPPVLEDAETPVPLETLLGVVLAPPEEDDAREALLHQVREEPRQADALWLANGDRMAGVIARIGSEAITVDLDAGPVELPRSTVVAFAYDPALVEYPEPIGTYLDVTFIDGSRLGLTDPRIEQGRLVARTRFGAEIRPAIRSIARIVVLGSSVAYLSAQAESAAEYLGYLGHHPETYGRDRTWDGHPLRLDGIPYDRGLGTLPLTRLAYVLDPEDRRFQAIVGLDDRAGERASVVFRVFVDREERFASPPLTPRDEPMFVDVDLSGGRVLILVTEFGESGDVEDFADWVDARLIR